MQESYALQAEAQRLASDAASLEAEALKRRPLLDLLGDAPGNLARLQVLQHASCVLVARALPKTTPPLATR